MFVRAVFLCQSSFDRSAKVAESCSALDLSSVVSFFLAYCVSVRNIIFLVCTIPSAIVVSDGLFCISWSKGLFCRCRSLCVLKWDIIWVCCTSCVHGRRFRLLKFLWTGGARQFVLRFARTQTLSFALTKCSVVKSTDPIQGFLALYREGTTFLVIVGFDVFRRTQRRRVQRQHLHTTSSTRRLPTNDH